MMDRLFSEPAFSVLYKGLDAGSLRHKTIASNLANVNTPGYKKSYVSFEQDLKKALATKESAVARTHPDHMPIRTSRPEVTPRVGTVTGTAMRGDGNNVDIDAEMADLSVNSMRYNTMAQIMGMRFRVLNSVITEGRR